MALCAVIGFVIAPRIDSRLGTPAPLAAAWDRCFDFDDVAAPLRAGAAFGGTELVCRGDRFVTEGFSLFDLQIHYVKSGGPRNTKGKTKHHLRIPRFSWRTLAFLFRGGRHSSLGLGLFLLVVGFPHS